MFYKYIQFVNNNKQLKLVRAYGNIINFTPNLLKKY